MAITEKPTDTETHELEERWEDAPGIPVRLRAMDEPLRRGICYCTAWLVAECLGATPGEGDP